MTRFKLLVCFLISLFAIWWFGRPIADLINRADRIEELREEVKSLEEKKENLVKEVEYSRSLGFVEKEARNRLNLSKPGEKVVILPPNAVLPGESDAASSSMQEVPVWRQWYRLFFE